MILCVVPHVFSGTVRVPASKSHTIRRLFLAALTDGESRIENPLDSLDGRSCAGACRILGAEVDACFEDGTLAAYTVRGKGRERNERRIIDVGNSGTTLFFGLAAAALGGDPVTFTGDEQIARRGAAPLLDALRGLGIGVESQNGCTPITVCGPWKGGRVSLPCPTSQYLSALLIAAPLAPAGVISEIDVPLLNEKPYAAMTLAYLNAQDIPLEYDTAYSRFCIPGGASYKPVNGRVAGDFSSAAFPAAAAVISGGKVRLSGLDPGDLQGDKFFFSCLSEMGCDVRWEGAELTVSRNAPLRGAVFDLNATPDMLPVMAALAVFAEGRTELVNAAHARIKETDRIAVMAGELNRLFGTKVCEERPEGLVIHGRPAVPKPCASLDGRGDHRVVMALACAALGMDRPVDISGAEAADVTYPGFLRLLAS